MHFINFALPSHTYAYSTIDANVMFRQNEFW